MDLNTLFAADQAVIELKHPVTGKALLDDSKKPQPFSLTVIGQHTKKYKQISRRIGYLAHKRNKTLKLEDMSFEEFSSAVDENEINALEILAESIVDCNIVFNGEKIKCTKESMLDLLSDERFAWIEEQYLAEVAAGKAFFKA